MGIGHIVLAQPMRAAVNGALSRNGGLWTNPEILNVTFHNYTRAYVTSDYRLRRLLSLLD